MQKWHQGSETNALQCVEDSCTMNDNEYKLSYKMLGGLSLESIEKVKGLKMNTNIYSVVVKPSLILDHTNHKCE